MRFARPTASSAWARPCVNPSAWLISNQRVPARSPPGPEPRHPRPRCRPTRLLSYRCFVNVFYTGRQRSGEPGYRLEVQVHTGAGLGGVEICIAERPGHEHGRAAEIFQPFFTTKLPSEGTGLGLSLAHDIIAQGHGGTLSVESQAGQDITFSVSMRLKGVMQQLAS